MTTTDQIHPAYLRLAGLLLRKAADEFGSHGCNDFKWPTWFPVELRERFAYDMEMANSGDNGEATLIASESTGEYAPADFCCMGYLANALTKAGGGDPSADGDE